jgi:hypothetical protein
VDQRSGDVPGHPAAQATLNVTGLLAHQYLAARKQTCFLEEEQQPASLNKIAGSLFIHVSEVEMRLYSNLLRPGKLLLAALLCAVACLPGPAGAQVPLATGFLNPPASARPHTWWHWLNGNVTRAGITADLEAMARVGVGGAEIFNVDQGIPAGPVRFMSPQWLDMMKFAGSEANRLGLELCMMNCAGWSSSGGPWNTPDHAMQFLTFSEQHVTGPLAFDGVLAQPKTRLKTYHDIAVLAFRTPPAEIATMTAAKPTVTDSAPDVDARRLTDSNPATYIWLPKPTTGRPAWIQFQFPAPLPVLSAIMRNGLKPWV